MGIGVDVCDIARFAESLDRTPGLASRLFTVVEREGLRVEQLAARFAAKEAVAKALGTPYAGGWHEVVVEGGGSSRPTLALAGRAAEAAAAAGISRWHLSLSHDGGVAVAYVVAEGA